MMKRYLNGLAYEALDRRDATYEAMRSTEDVAAYQKRMRAFFIEQLGGFPDRTALNARVVKTDSVDGCRIERVLFESRPNHHVTGLLYLPEGGGPFPAVLMLCGHQLKNQGKEQYFGHCLFLAKNGFVTFCIDCIGQGERHQVLDADGEPPYYPSLEHMVVGLGSILVGRSAATYFVWDAVRAVDYLVSRDDIDAERIGCTGGSGGGTQTAYLMALDPRVACAAPRNYMTSLRRLVDTIGPQDAEQNIHRQIDFGMGHGDFIIMSAPTPVLLLTGTHDSFDIQGTWATFREAKRVYARLGCPERVDLYEADAGHGATEGMMVALVRWMRRWLAGVDSAEVAVHDLDAQPDDALHCTESGHVLLLKDERSVLDLNAEEAKRLAEQRRTFWERTSKEEALEKVRSIAGVRPLVDLPMPHCEHVGSEERGDCRMDRLILVCEPGVWLPTLLFVPKPSDGEAYVYAHGEGKDVDAGPGGQIEELVKAGHLVLAVDLRGFGETQATTEEKEYAQVFGPNWREFYLAYMLGKTYLGMRIEDLLVCMRFLSEYHAVSGRLVHLVGVGEAAAPALHAAALERDLVASLILRGMIRSWSDLAGAPPPRDQLANAVHGALEWYDLDNLLDTLPPGSWRTE